VQRLEKIDGLEGCPRLKKLWLIENRISVIENLQPCAGLQELYLTSNRITAIGGLDGLVDLQVIQRLLPVNCAPLAVITRSSHM
jgi:protein phosphatase 1 regulatory subunit 7